jgi:hypothetical protein
MMHYPNVRWNWSGRSVVVEFVLLADDVLAKSLNMVADLDEAEEPISIEVIDLASQAGISGESIPTKGGDDGKFPRWSYDAQSDSFYLRLRKGRSRTQRELKGSVLVTQDGRMAGLRVGWG